MKENNKECMSKEDIIKHLNRKFPPKESENWKEYCERTDDAKSEYLSKIADRGRFLLKPNTLEKARNMANNYGTGIRNWFELSALIGGSVWLPSEIKYKFSSDNEEIPSSINIANLTKNYITDARKETDRYNWSFFNSDYAPRISQIITNQNSDLGAFIIEQENRGTVSEAVYGFKVNKGHAQIKLIVKDREYEMNKNPNSFFRHVFPEHEIQEGNLKIAKLRKPSEKDELREYNLEQIL